LYNSMKVENNVCIWPKWRGLSKAEGRKQLNIGLKDWKFKVGGIRKQELSKGMVSKFSLWFVCCTNPNCWFWRAFSGFDRMPIDEIQLWEKRCDDLFYAPNGKCGRALWSYRLNP
jgi:ABC-type uncharacterized transport system ATPase subunit